MVILYRSRDKLDFVQHINNVFTETGGLDKQECYLLRDLNFNLLLDKIEIFSNKSYCQSYWTDCQNLLPLTKGYLDFCFFFSMEQLISIPTRVTSKTAILIDHVLINSSQKVSHYGVIELGISDHNPVYCTRKIPPLKLNKHNYISIRSTKYYTKEKVLELLRKTDFPN